MSSRRVGRGLPALAAVAVLVALVGSPGVGRSSTPPPDRSAEVVRGHQWARIMAPVGVVIADYENDGYRVRRLAEHPDGQVEVLVEVWADGRSMEPSAGLDPVPRGTAALGASPAVMRLARALTARHPDPEERARRLGSWVARNIDYRLDRALSQAPEAVLQRRDAYCTGAARLLVALLDSAGLEAREVPGFAMEGNGSSPAGFHRWVEYRAPGGRWRFVDPLATFGFVPATFVRLEGEELPRAAVGRRWQLLELQDDLQVVGHDPRLPPGLRTVPTALTRSQGARVRIVVPDDRSGVELRAVLKGAWIRERSLAGGGEVVFADVSAGTYEVLVERRGGNAGGAVASPVLQRGLVVTPQQAMDGRLLEVRIGRPLAVTGSRTVPTASPR